MALEKKRAEKEDDQTDKGFFPNHTRTCRSVRKECVEDRKSAIRFQYRLRVRTQLAMLSGIHRERHMSRPLPAIPAAEFRRFMRVIRKLRKECPWDRKQTSASLKPFLVEECYEVIDALDEEDPAKVKEELGDLLFQIDPRQFQAAVDQAKADLAQKKARWDTTQANLARIKPLAEQNAVSKKDLDDAVGQEQAAHASYDASKAALDKAQLDLSFTYITSPITGIAGTARAQIGNLVGPGQTEDQIQPIESDRVSSTSLV